MQPLTVELSDSLRRRVEERAAAAGFGTTGDFVRDLLEREVGQNDRERLEALLIEGLDSGEPEEADDAWWAERHAELDRRIARES